MLPTRRHDISRLEAFSDAHEGPAHWILGLSSSRRRKAIETGVAPAAGV